ncbi:NAD(P)H-binding protein [Nocardioides agariphilus]|jgi:uncharacterized protein YbjT (DUF2867 family)|uniref:NAD(P)H-binding protein n=1 Tax=Nocardioides agariphilus TaxID=433664 RepID=A0A930YKL3_9ACTN|nr:NAD(P)H-binding protein [Nocardioides agariphilus]MBF4766169.1 NAD(P)H-binding protein [Nocardioides agariphilus]
MRIVVLGATGYVGSRLVPQLLEAGHEVVAASSSATQPGRFSWSDQVTWRQCDVTDRRAVAKALRDADGVCYLVHSLKRRGFADRDRLGATHVRDAASSTGVRRIVYLSGLVPRLDRGEGLSAHLASRLEVEQILAAADCSTLSLRAGVVIGAGSTSYEVVRQLASLLLVQPVPSWMRTSVQPVAVSDVLRALVAAFDDGAPEGDLDLGGPDVLRYPDLLAAYSRAALLPRLRVPVPIAPVAAVGVTTALLVGAPFHTVTALVDSLRHDMVCRPDHQWSPGEQPFLGVEEALARSLGLHGCDVPEAPLASDPAWTRMRAPVFDELHAPTVVRAGASLALRRLADVRGVFRNAAGL